MAATVDLNARYTVDGWDGIAFYVHKYPIVEVLYDPYTDEYGDEITDHDHVIMVMVGDDREHFVEVDSITVIDDEDYCPDCGQIGCHGAG